MVWEGGGGNSAPYPIKGSGAENCPVKGMAAMDWRANWRAATLPRRSALLVFAALRRRGLAECAVGEMLAVT